MARSNEYDNHGRIILRDTQGTIISMYRFMQFVLGPSSNPWAPPYYYGGYADHLGYDFGAPAYSEVRSTCTGKVTLIYENDSDAGYGVCIEETGQAIGAQVRTHRYTHFVEEPVVTLGDIVQQGTLIGYVGGTGDVTGTLLTYDVTTGGPFGTVIDAWAQFNHNSEPSGWTPQAVTNASGSPYGRNIGWSCIGETTGVNYGPGNAGGGASIIPVTFYTGQAVHDVSWCNMANLNSFSQGSVGGLIIQIGSMRDANDTINKLSQFKQWVSKYKGIIPLGFYVYSYLSYTSDEATIKRKFQVFVNALETEGITAKLAPLGIWLDLEWDGPTPTADRSQNFKQVQWFREVFAAKGYPTVGLYTSPAYILQYFNLSDCAQIPIWLAAWVNSSGTGTASSKDQLPNYVNSTVYNALKDKIYLWQDGSSSFPGGIVDHDWMIQPIPGVGTTTSDPNDDDGDSSPSYNEAWGDPEIVQPYHLNVWPNGGYISPTTPVLITTDAPDSVIRYTIDNTTPSLINGYTYITYQELLQTIGEGTRYVFLRIRVYSTLTGAEEARGAATFFIHWEDAEPITSEQLPEFAVAPPYLVRITD